MPYAPKTLRPKAAIIRSADADYEARRRKASAWRAWYKTAQWLAIRAAQLAAEPNCRMCAQAEPPRLTPATVCDHREPHRGDPVKFFGGPFQSLCGTCHNSDKQRQERSAPASV